MTTCVLLLDIPLTQRRNDVPSVSTPFAAAAASPPSSGWVDGSAWDDRSIRFNIEFSQTLPPQSRAPFLAAFLRHLKVTIFPALSSFPTAELVTRWNVMLVFIVSRVAHHHQPIV
jgi:hypothetical protein